MSAHPHYIIRAYHGTLPKNLSDILDHYASEQGGENGGESGTWFYDGGLDNFAIHWPGIFAVQCRTIWVTQHNSFDAR
jgi:hypothetical protein